MVKTTQIVREETYCHHMDYSFQLAAKVLLYASSYRQDSTYILKGNGRTEGRKEVFLFNDTLNTFFIYGYMASDIW